MSVRKLRWPLRLLLIAVTVQVVVRVGGPDVRGMSVVGLLEVAANLLIVVVVGYFLFILLAWLQRLLLWRIRRKLILSYLLIGLIPVVLIVSLFLLAGTLTVLSVSSFMVKLSLDDLAREATAVATAAAGELSGQPSAGVEAVLARYQRSLARRGIDPGVALVSARSGSDGRVVSVGDWVGRRPDGLPGWVEGYIFEGLVAVPSDRGVRIVARASQPVGANGALGVVIVDLPIDEGTAVRIERDIGAELRGASIVALDDAGQDRLIGVEPVVDVTVPGTAVSGEGLAWFTFLEYSDWDSGQPRYLTLQIRVSPTAFYQRVFGAQARIGDVSLGYAILVALAAVGGLFLVIELAAFVMGFALAKSITGSVHELFVGTQHVRRGDFTHRIRVQTRDQLGELAESFNAMTSSVRDLLQQAEAKKRLEEELRIAREVQMSLLPRETTTIPGLDITATCLPAREVGGDYYDLFRLGERRLGVLVADVSGKGTSAAFYMAELKGVVLSLSQVHQSPRELLLEVNRIMTKTIDSRSFVTMIYAVIDLDRRTLTYARAGHTPLIHASTDGRGKVVQVLTPSGLVVGLGGFEQQFEELLEEESRSVSDGDLILLFTDGVTEAMNERDDLFGEERLTKVIEGYHDRSPEAIQTQILRDIKAFVGATSQHDDMTMVVVKVGEQRTH